MIERIFLTLLLILPLSLNAQDISKTELEKKVNDYSFHSLKEFKEFLSLANNAHFAKDIEENIIWCENAFRKRGFITERLTTKRLPLLLASKVIPNAKKTVLIYLQIDGQPVDTARWHQENPYGAALKELDNNGIWNTIDWGNLKTNLNPDWRIFARSVSDAKGPAMMFLTAVDIINDVGFNPNYSIKVIMDFEEELGSPNLPRAVEVHREKLASDMLVIFDGPRHVSNQPTLLFGARGISRISLKVYGPKVPQHSGHYGNYTPNPALQLSQLLGSMFNEEGKVIIPNWYNGITISDEAKKQMDRVPDNEEKMRQELGIKTIDAIGTTYQEALQYPSLSILGLNSAWTGNETRTVIPASALTELNIRLVKETKGERMVNLVKNHIKNKGYHFVDSEPTDEERSKFSKLARFREVTFYEAFRTDFDSDIGIWLRKAMNKAFGKEPIQLRTSGGSIPISPFVNTLNIPAVIVPTVNKDNNQHSPNENLRLGNYIDGVKTITSILIEKL